MSRSDVQRCGCCGSVLAEEDIEIDLQRCKPCRMGTCPNCEDEDLEDEIERTPDMEDI